MQVAERPTRDTFTGPPQRLVELVTALIAYMDLASQPGLSQPKVQQYLRRGVELTEEIKTLLYGGDLS